MNRSFFFLSSIKSVNPVSITQCTLEAKRQLAMTITFKIKATVELVASNFQEINRNRGVQYNPQSFPQTSR